jgi:hypothetical protein
MNGIIELPYIFGIARERRRPYRFQGLPQFGMSVNLWVQHEANPCDAVCQLHSVVFSLGVPQTVISLGRWPTFPLRQMKPSCRTNDIHNAFAQFIDPSIPSHYLCVTPLLSLLPEGHDKLNKGSNDTSNNCSKRGLKSCVPSAAHNVLPPDVVSIFPILARSTAIHIYTILRFPAKSTYHLQTAPS